MTRGPGAKRQPDPLGRTPRGRRRDRRAAHGAGGTSGGDRLASPHDHDHQHHDDDVQFDDRRLDLGAHGCHVDDLHHQRGRRPGAIGTDDQDNVGRGCEVSWPPPASVTSGDGWLPAGRW